MCLNSPNNNQAPGNIRWKILREDGLGISSLYVRKQMWREGEWNQSEFIVHGRGVFGNLHSPSHNPQDHGFHCYVHFADVLEELKLLRKCTSVDETLCLAVMEVDGFIAGGLADAWQYREVQAETWKRARLLTSEKAPLGQNDPFYNNTRKPLCA